MRFPLDSALAVRSLWTWRLLLLLLLRWDDASLDCDDLATLGNFETLPWWPPGKQMWSPRRETARHPQQYRGQMSGLMQPATRTGGEDTGWHVSTWWE